MIPGNLLVMPIGNSVLYAEPLFLQSRTQGIQAAPRLSWVVLAFSDRVVVGKTYQEALRQLFGDSAPLPSPTTVEPSKPADARSSEVRKALDLLNQADQAMRRGDWATYGELQKRLKAKLEELSAK